MIGSSCLCGNTRWEIDTTGASMGHCHCSMCRKAHGAPFATFITIPESQFRWVTGKDDLVTYRGNENSTLLRSFCPVCGSAGPVTDGSYAYVPAGCLDEDPGIRPTEHVFVGSKAPWHTIADDLNQFDGYDPATGLEAFDAPQGEHAPAGAVGGSCLCGAVAFHVTEPFQVVHNCHCSRCRKARAAAHTTNGFVSGRGVTFLRGEDNLAAYQPPDAKSFTHVFCKTCGSGMPRANREGNYTTVPFGALDDDPGARPNDHIYVGSKAPWYDFRDDLPAFEELPG